LPASIGKIIEPLHAKQIVKLKDRARPQAGNGEQRWQSSRELCAHAL
jgi:hypothetical protein